MSFVDTAVQLKCGGGATKQAKAKISSGAGISAFEVVSGEKAPTNEDSAKVSFAM